VAEYDPPRRFALNVLDGPMPFDGAWTFHPAGAGTRVEFEGSGDLTGAKSLLAPIARAGLARTFKAHHARLKSALEPSPNP
jgi:Polyketide cyclase / dehydrase and lipid transport